MIVQGSESREGGWGAYGAMEWVDAMLAAMKRGGVDNLFFVS